MIYMFLSNNPSSGDINLSNLPCFTFKSNPQVEGVRKYRICACMVLYALFPLI